MINPRVCLTFANRKLLLKSKSALIYKKDEITKPTYIAYGYLYYNSKYIYHLFGSDDGLSWIEMTLPSGSWSNFVCVHNLYVGYNSSQIALSADGQEWRIIAATTLLGNNKPSIRRIVARQARDDFMIVYSDSTSSYQKAALTSDFQSCTQLGTLSGSDSRTVYVYSAGQYYFFNYSGSYSSEYRYYLNDTTNQWVSYSIPNVFSSSQSYASNDWDIGDAAVTFDGTYYHIYGSGSPGASSPIYKCYQAIHAYTTNPTSRWSSGKVGILAGSQSRAGGGAYMYQHISENTGWWPTNIRSFFRFNGGSATQYQVASDHPYYSIFRPIGRHTFCWQSSSSGKPERIINSTLYPVEFPIDISCNSICCINVPSRY